MSFPLLHHHAYRAARTPNNPRRASPRVPRARCASLTPSRPRVATGDEGTSQFRIDVDVRNRLWGPLFGYRDRVDVEWKRCAAGEVPKHVKPLREERRE